MKTAAQVNSGRCFHLVTCELYRFRSTTIALRAFLIFFMHWVLAFWAFFVHGVIVLVYCLGRPFAANKAVFWIVNPQIKHVNPRSLPIQYDAEMGQAFVQE